MEDPIMNNIIKTQQELVDEVAWRIDKTAFRNCYERRDPSIRFIAIISPEWPMAELVASLLQGAPEPKSLDQLATDGVVRIIPPYLELQADCNRPSAIQDHAWALRKNLAKQMNRAVRCFYCPPGYFVQFTGENWQ